MGLIWKIFRRLKIFWNDIQQIVIFLISMIALLSIQRFVEGFIDV